VKGFMKASLGTVTALAIIFAASAFAAQAQKNDGSKSAPAPTPATTDAGYIIGAQDVLSIDVWKNQEVSRSVPVRPDGKISLPLLNDVQAAGLTPMQLQTNLRDALKKFMSDPQVTVIVTQINSQRIYVLGEVAHPGAFLMLPHMNVLQALSTAGGFSQFAKESGVYVLRTENGKQVTLPFNYKEVVRGKRADQNIELKPGDTVVVP
jgi:polysaccharide biosynthesis/export protein